MSYSNTGSDEISKIRTLIYDITDEGTPVRGEDYFYEDAEIEQTLDSNSDDLYGSAADLSRGLSLKFAREAREINLGKEDIEIKWERSRWYSEMAKQYDAKSVGGGASEFVDASGIFYTRTGVDASDYIGLDD